MKIVYINKASMPGAPKALTRRGTVTRKIPAVEGITRERLYTLFKQALGGQQTEATCDEILALAANALRILGDPMPEKVIINRGVRCFLLPAKVLPFRRPEP